METYRVPVEQILIGADYSSANYEVAKNALRNMAKTTVEWSVIGDDGEEDGVELRWGLSSLLADAEFIVINNRVYLEWSYGPKIRNHLLDPSRYVQLSLKICSGLKTGTAVALYEICMRYLTNAGGLTNKAEWEWWRPRLTGIPDADSDQQREYRYFKRDALVPAINEINALTDIEVELREFKTGRKITHIQFSSKRKAQGILEVDCQKSIVDDDLMRRILAFGIVDTLAAKLYASRDEETVRATVEYVEGRIQKGGVESPAALFRDALKRGYGKQEAERSREKVPPASKAATPQKVIEVEPKDSEAQRARLSAQAYIDGLEPGDKASLIDSFVASLEGLLLEQYRKRGLKSKIVEAGLLKYIQEKRLSA